MSLFRRFKEAGVVPASLLVAMAGLAACGHEASNSPIPVGATLDCPTFQTTVSPIFDMNIGGRTCSASGCHLVGQSAGGAFKIYANPALNSAEMQYNYLVAKAFSNLTTPIDSKLLLEPLAGAQSIVGSHAGGDIFSSTADPLYQTILTWISSQVPPPRDCLP